MKTHRLLLTLLALGLAIILGACDSLPQPSGAPGIETDASSKSALAERGFAVSATGKVVPERDALLSVSAGGVVENVLVKKGDKVTAGEVLVQLEGTEQQSAAVSAAELEVVNAQFALDSLYNDTNLLAAEALRSAEIAEQDLEDLHNFEEKEAQALREVAAAQKTYEQAERNLAFLTKVPSQSVIDQAYANMLLAENKLKKATEDVEDAERELKKYSKYPSVGQIFPTSA